MAEQSYHRLKGSLGMGAHCEEADPGSGPIPRRPRWPVRRIPVMLGKPGQRRLHPMAPGFSLHVGAPPTTRSLHWQGAIRPDRAGRSCHIWKWVQVRVYAGALAQDGAPPQAGTRGRGKGEISHAGPWR